MKYEKNFILNSADEMLGTDRIIFQPGKEEHTQLSFPLYYHSFSFTLSAFLGGEGGSTGHYMNGRKIAASHC